MGWDYTYLPEGASIKEFLKKELNALEVEIVEHEDGAVAYAAVERDGEITATVCLFTINPPLEHAELVEECNFGYKTLEECESPVACCPISILNLLTPGVNANEDWRRESRANSYFLESLRHVEEGRYKRGIEACKRSLEIEHDERAEYSLYDKILFAGITAYTEERYADAIEPFELYLEIYGEEDLKLWAMLGDSYNALAQHEKAINALKCGIEVGQKAVKGNLKTKDRKIDLECLYTILGQAYAALGRHKEAIEAFGRAFYLNEDNETADIGLREELEKLGDECVQEGRYEEALEAFKKLVELDEFSAMRRLKLGLAYLKLGRRDDGVREMREAYQLDWSEVSDDDEEIKRTIKEAVENALG